MAVVIFCLHREMHKDLSLLPRRTQHSEKLEKREKNYRLKLTKI